MFAEVPEIDVIVVGEGEQTFMELIEATSMGEDLDRVRGLFLNQDHHCLFTGPRAQLIGDAIPTPRWELLDIVTNFNIVIGFSGETKQTLDRTIDLIQEAQPDAFSCFVLFVAPHMRISEHPERYGLSGSGLSWSHATMNSEEANEALERISKSVTNPCSFPGAEAFAGYLTAVGYSTEQIRAFFKATNQLTHGAKDEANRAIVKKACNSLRDLW